MQISLAKDHCSGQKIKVTERSTGGPDNASASLPNCFEEPVSKCQTLDKRYIGLQMIAHLIFRELFTQDLTS